MPRQYPGFENMPVAHVGEWHGTPSDLPDLAMLDIDPSTHRAVGQREVIDIRPEDNIQTVSSAGFTACTGIVLRDNTSGVHTFAHIQPHVMSLESHLRGRHIQSGEAVVLLGSRSYIPNSVYDLRDGEWGSVDVRVMPIDSGNNWWSCVLDVAAGHILFARSDPSQDLLCGPAFAPIGHSEAA